MDKTAHNDVLLLPASDLPVLPISVIEESTRDTASNIIVLLSYRHADIVQRVHIQPHFPSK